MRLITGAASPAPDKLAPNRQQSAKDISGSAARYGKRRLPRTTREDAAPANGERSAAAPVAAAITDYTRPTDTSQLLLDLQRRVIEVEQRQTRKLTAGEYAIAVEAMTGRKVEQWQRDGYVVSPCQCGKHTCKGWNMTPIEHHRTAAKPPSANTEPVTAAELKDIAPPTVEHARQHREKVFARMFTEGKLKKGKNDSTIIPKDGPITWTHEEQLAFAQGFEMEELLELELKPRELQRRLITALRELGYKILSAPEK